MLYLRMLTQEPQRQASLDISPTLQRRISENCRNFCNALRNGQSSKSFSHQVTRVCFEIFNRNHWGLDM